MGVRAAQAIEERQYVFLILNWLVGVYTSIMVRLSFALPVSFLYRLYREKLKRKFFCFSLNEMVEWGEKKNLLISKFAN